MALFAPTFIYPDARNGIGQGTIDATQDLKVSWRVNGASAMVAFQIVIYQNNAASTQLYTTGRITNGCPFYGMTAQGEIQFFSYTISAATLSAAGITNGNEYKLIITQWWSANDSIAQPSASAFITRSAPTLSIPPIGTLNVRYYTFSGTYTQAQGDVLNWFRWQLAYQDNQSEIIYDSGNISGTMDISMYYDGFFAGTGYSVKLDVQTENGIEATTGWVDFAISYTPQPIGGRIATKCLPTAVKVDFSAISYIPGTATGAYSIENQMLSLPSGSSVEWNSVNGSPMSFSAPWSILSRLTLAQTDVVLWTIGQESGNLTLSYANSTETLTLSKGAETLCELSPINNSHTVTVILTPDTMYVRDEYKTGGLYPSTTLYPGSTLYPKTDDIVMANFFSASVDYEQANITSVSIAGPATFDYMEVIQGTPSEETMQQAYYSGVYTPGETEADYFLARFTDGLDAGNLSTNGAGLVGYALYRREGTSGVLSHIANTLPTQTWVYDYGAKSQHQYTYYLFPLGETSYIADPIEGDTVSTCFWDWTVIEASQSDRNTWNVVSVYRFGLNLSSGAVSNNNQPNVLQNHTRYPTVQLATPNYKGGTLQSLIGSVNQGQYSDSVALMDEIFGLSNTANDIFLKTRKGELLKIRISDAITMATMDETREQAKTVSLPWVEVGSTDKVSLIADAPIGMGVAS